MNKQKAVYQMLKLGCWHEWVDKFEGPIMFLGKPIEGKDFKVKNYHQVKCSCGLTTHSQGWDTHLAEDNPDLTSWEGFGLLWQAAQTMEWWDSFWYGHGTTTKFINPQAFLDALYSFGVETGRIGA